MNIPAFERVGWLAFYCLLVLFASLAGGWLPSLLRLSHTRLQVAVSFVAGLMLGLALLNLLLHAAEELHSLRAAATGLVAGFLVMFFLQRFLPFHHHDVPEGQPVHACGHAHSLGEFSARHLDWMSVAIGLALHSVFDGLALAAAAMAEERGHGHAVGWGTALAVVLHKPFGAMAISTLMAVGNAPRRWLFPVNAAFALVTPLGALLFFLSSGHLAQVHPEWLGWALAFCAGTFLYIASADLLPELQFHAHDRFILSLALVAGLAAAIFIGKFGHAEHEHHRDSVPPAHSLTQSLTQFAAEPGFADFPENMTRLTPNYL